METHYRIKGTRGKPLCWGDEWLNEAVMTHPNIAEVTCSDCLNLYYAPVPNTDPSHPVVFFDLWLDGPEIGESTGWRHPIVMDYHRFEVDEEYRRLVSEYIDRALLNLAKEVEEIGLVLPPSEEALQILRERFVR